MEAVSESTQPTIKVTMKYAGKEMLYYLGREAGQHIVIGRLKDPQLKKVRGLDGKLQRLYIHDTNHVSNEHALLEVRRVNQQLREGWMLKLKNLRCLPLQLLRMIMGYTSQTYVVLLQDLNSTAGTYARLHRYVLRQKENFYLENHQSQQLQRFQNPYCHSPSQKMKELKNHPQLMKKQLEACGSGLLSIIRSASWQNIICSSEEMKTMMFNWSMGNPSLLQINEYLYTRHVAIIGYKFRMYVFINHNAEQSSFRFRSDQGTDLFTASITPSNQLRIATTNNIYNNMKQRKEGDLYKPHCISTQEKVVLADNRILEIKVSQTY